MSPKVHFAFTPTQEHWKPFKATQCLDLAVKYGIAGLVSVQDPKPSNLLDFGSPVPHLPKVQGQGEITEGFLNALFIICRSQIGEISNLGRGV